MLNEIDIKNLVKRLILSLSGITLLQEGHLEEESSAENVKNIN